MPSQLFQPVDQSADRGGAIAPRVPYPREVCRLVDMGKTRRPRSGRPTPVRLGACMIFIPLALMAADPPVLPSRLDLPQAIRMAHEFNPLLQEARERIVEQAGSLTATESERLPKVNALGVYQWEDSERIGSFGGSGETDEEYWRAGVAVTQPLYSGGLLNATVRSKRFQTQALEAQVIAAQTKVMGAVHRNFYGALLAREVVNVQKESLELLERQLTLARNRFDAGAGPRFDVLQAEVRLANARPPLIRAINNYRIAIDQLRTSLGAVYAGQLSPADIQLDGSLQESTDIIDLDAAIAEALENRPELEALSRLRAAAEQDVKRSRAQRAPRINLFADYRFENDRYSPESDTLQGWQAGLEASLNVWEGGRIRGEVAQARSRLQQVDFQDDASRLNVELEVRTAWNRTGEAREILDAATLGITQAEEALRLAENRFSVGALTQLDVLSSQLEYTRAKLERITALHDFQIARIELQQAIGRVPGAEYLP